MQYISTFLKTILNILFYSIYTVISMLFGGWLYGLILSNKWLPIPENGDSIYFKLAVLIAIFVLILTFYFRKYFYISVSMKHKNTPEDESVMNTKKTVIQEPKKSKSYILSEDQDKIEIFIDKEIK